MHLILPDIVRLLLGLALLPPTVFVVMVTAYLALLAFGAWRYRKPTRHDAPLQRMALLIPAHNEGKPLAAVVQSARAMSYPTEYLDVFVIADNCDDDTAAVARDNGAHVFERTDQDARGKGQALDWALRQQRDVFKGYDIIALVDADMIIDAAFAREIAGNLACPGVEAVQGLYSIANPEKTWRTGIGYIGFAVINHLRPAGRCWLGGTAELKGSGMAFRAPLLLRYGWPAHSLAEDAEFGRMLLSDGIRVHYNPDAKVASELPQRPEQLAVQQQRWEGGKLQLFRAYALPFARRLLRNPSIAALDAMLDMLTPPQTLFFALQIVGALAALFVHPLWAALLFGCLLVNACVIASALLQLRAPLRIWLYLLAAPGLLLSKTPTYFRMLRQRGAAAVWQRTPRDNELR